MKTLDVTPPIQSKCDKVPENIETSQLVFRLQPPLLLETAKKTRLKKKQIALTCAAVNLCFGLYFTKSSTRPISSFVVKLGKIFSHSSRLLFGNL